jgi:hypothetical protein
MDPLAIKYANPALQPVVDDITLRLESSVGILEEHAGAGANLQSRSIEAIRLSVPALEIQPVVDQFGFIAKVASDIHKLSTALHEDLTPEDGSRPTDDA